MRPTHRFRLIVLLVIALVVLSVLAVVNLEHTRSTVAQTTAAAPTAWGRP